ncbi:hypothetical protein QQ045_026659 [Rhodiola kirilowii]
MSVSISLNPRSRRRPVLTTDRKIATPTSVALLGLDTVATADNNINGSNAQDNGDVSGIREFRDLRAPLVLERSMDHVQVKPGLPHDVVTPRRSRRKPVKPLWLFVVRVFVNNFVLLVVLLGFVQLVYRLAVKSGGGDVVVGNGTGAVVELEGRLADMEKALKNAEKLMQVQVENVDGKLGNEIAGLREEFGKIIEEKSVGLENELHKLDGRVESFETVLERLSLDEFLTKKECEKIKENLKNVGNGNKDISLDDLRDYAKGVVEREIEKHAADGLGKVDYALASAGGKVVKHSEPFVVKKGIWFGGRNVAHQDAEVMLRPSFGEPGQCFPLRGSSGFVQVRLRTAIILESITLEHVAKNVAYDLSSAPKDCRVFGWLQGPEVVNSEKMFLLSEFSYDLDKHSAQTFPVSDSAGGSLVNMVRLDFTSNHGSPTHTCIYRLRVHGQEPKSLSVIELQS